MNLNGLAVEYIDKFARTGLVYKWETGKTLATLRSVKRISKELPETLDTYNLPLFSLLENRRLSSAQVRKLLQGYLSTDEWLFPYAFPNDDELRKQHRFVPTLALDDSKSLFARGDIYGFTVILALVWEAEAKGGAAEHWMHAANLYRAIPNVCRIPWFRRNLSLLRECVETIHCRGSVPHALLEFDVDWNVIQNQIEAPTHETIREKRSRDPVTLRYVDLEDLIRYRGIHSPITIPKWIS